MWVVFFFSLFLSLICFKNLLVIFFKVLFGQVQQKVISFLLLYEYDDYSDFIYICGINFVDLVENIVLRVQKFNIKRLIEFFCFLVGYINYEIYENLVINDDLII